MHLHGDGGDFRRITSAIDVVWRANCEWCKWIESTKWRILKKPSWKNIQSFHVRTERGVAMSVFKETCANLYTPLCICLSSVTNPQKLKTWSLNHRLIVLVQQLSIIAFCDREYGFVTTFCNKQSRAWPIKSSVQFNNVRNKFRLSDAAGGFNAVLTQSLQQRYSAKGMYEHPSRFRQNRLFQGAHNEVGHFLFGLRICASHGSTPNDRRWFVRPKRR